MAMMSRIGLLLAIALLLAAPAWPQFTLKVGVDMVNVLFTVTDAKGRLVGGLNRTDFAVEEDGRKQDIVHFSRENELPLTIGMLIDTSPSVRGVFDEERVTAIGFLKTILRKSDLAFVIGFDRGVTLFEDFTYNVSRLEKTISSMELGPERDGGTSLYDAVYLAAKEQLAKEAGRKTIILLSDGEDTTSRVRFMEALVAVHRHDVVIYSISNDERGFYGPRRFGNGDPGTMKKFSEETGGNYYMLDRKNDFARIFNEIAADLRSQYSLSYQSTNSVRDGKFRKIRIVAKDPSLKVRARKGYYAPHDHDSR